MSEQNGTSTVRRAAGIRLTKPFSGCYHLGIEITGAERGIQVSVWLWPPELAGASLINCAGNAFVFRLENGIVSAGCAEMVCRPELDPELGKTVLLAIDPPA